MAAVNDPLDDPGEGLPVSPARRRVAIVAGILLVLVILVALLWFSITNTETSDDPGRLLGRADAVHVPPPG